MTRRSILVPLLAAALAVTSRCADAQLATAPAIDPAEARVLAAGGTGSVSGRVVAHLVGDRVRYFDHWQVFLVPVIPYTHFYEHKVIAAWRDDGGRIDPPDPAWAKLVRATFTNADGYFSFKNLPSHGTYFVYSIVDVKDGRQETLTSSSYEQTGTTTMIDGDGHPMGMLPNYGYVDHPYTHDYRCETSGVVGGAVRIDRGEAVTVPLALFGAQNNGC